MEIHFKRLQSEALQYLGLDIPDELEDVCGAYVRLLAEWNQKMSLTSIKDSEGVRIKHLLDSFSCVLAFADSPPRALVDVGTGAGFPGVPLKFLYPDMRLTLVESSTKKATFLETVVSELGLSDTTVLNLRAEQVGQRQDHREAYDWAVARAVAGMPILLEYLLPLVRVGGAALAQKGSSAPDELAQAKNAMKILGGGQSELIEVELPLIDDQRYLAVIQKVKPTPVQYPRREGVPAKRPI